MNKFVYRDEEGHEQRLLFHGWGEDGRTLHTTTQDGKPAIVVLSAAYPGPRGTNVRYRFPPIVPQWIKPWRFADAWTEAQRSALHKWRAAELTAIDAMPLADLFPFDASRGKGQTHSPDEIAQARQKCREDIDWFVREMETQPEAVLLAPAFHYHEERLDRFVNSPFGEGIRRLFTDVTAFGRSWRKACSVRSQSFFDPSMPNWLRSVRFLMGAKDGSTYHLRGAEVRLHRSRKDTRERTSLAGEEPTAAVHGASFEGVHAKLDELAADVKGAKAAAEETRNRTHRLDQERRRKGGASTFRLKDYPEAFRFLRRELRRRAGAFGKRGKARAIDGAWQAFKAKFPDIAKEHPLSKGTLRNILEGNTGKIMGRNFKR